MGWNTANEIFDPVAQAMIDEQCSYSDKVRVLGVLIASLRELDWDTEDESLDAFRDDEAIVEAFRQQGVYTECSSTYLEESARLYQSWAVCGLEEGHVSDHLGRNGRTWPLIAGE